MAPLRRWLVFPQRQLPPRRRFSLSSTSVQFGTVGIGSTGNMNLTVSNTGSADLTVSVISVAGAQFGVSGDYNAEDNRCRPIRKWWDCPFNQQPAGAVAATLSITSNDPVNPTTTVALAGTGSSATFGQLQANPTSVSFGRREHRQQRHQAHHLEQYRNHCRPNFEHCGKAGTGFTVNGITVPFTLNAAATATINAVFAPTAVGSASGERGL